MTSEGDGTSESGTVSRVFDAHMHYVPRSALVELGNMENLQIRYDKEQDRFLRTGERQ